MKRKRILIASLSILGAVALLLFGAGMYLEARIGPILKEQVNNSIRGSFDFDKASLSLFRSFPRAQVRLEGVRLLCPAPFEGDTLLKIASAELTLELGALLREAGTPLPLRELQVQGADLRLLADREGRVNYDIGRPSGPEPAGEGFLLKLESYSFEEARIVYADSASGMVLQLERLQHSGSGDLSLKQSTLTTRSGGLFSLWYGGNAFLLQNPLQLDAILGVDLETDTYTFRENEARLNQMPLSFEGAVQLRDTGQWIDLAFRAPGTDFRNFLALIPEAYSGDLQGVETGGTFELSGWIRGLWSETGIPAFALQLRARDGSFQYPELPQKAEQIHLEATLYNESGQATGTALDLHEARFAIGPDTFSMKGRIAPLGEEAHVEGEIRGALDLANLSRAYPLKAPEGIRGRLLADLQTAFALEAIRQRRYQEVRTSGTLELTGASLPLEGYSHPLEVSRAALAFDPVTLRLDPLAGRMGDSDFELRGSFSDYLPYLLDSGVLRGEATLRSGRLLLADFQPADAGEDAPAAEAFRVPENVDVALQATAASVVYEQLALTNLSGGLRAAEGQLSLEGVRSAAMDGLLSLDGRLDTRGASPAFGLDLGIRGARMASALGSVELLRTLAPIASAIEGTFNARLRLGGLLQDGFAPDLMSLGGEAVAEVLTGRISANQAGVLEALASNLDFFDPETLDLKGLKTALAFEKGLVQVEPFSFTYRDIEVGVRGSHGFDRRLDYRLTLQVPARYLGGEVNRLLTALKYPELETARVPVEVSLTGTFSEPRLQSDLKASAAAFAGNLAAIQKERLKAAGEQQAGKLLEGLLKGGKDSTGPGELSGRPGDLSRVLQQVTGTGGADSLGKDTAPAGAQRARNLLKDLFGSRKDSVSSPRDSLPRRP